MRNITLSQSLTYLLLASVLSLLTYGLARNLLSLPYWVCIVGLLLMTLMALAAAMYSQIINQTRRLESFANRGWIYRLLSGRTLRLVLWVLVSFLLSLFMLLRLSSFDDLQWVALILLIPVFFSVYGLVQVPLAREYKSYMVIERSLAWARVLSSALMVLISFGLLLLFGELPEYGSLAEARNVVLPNDLQPGSSVFLYEAAGVIAALEAIQNYALGSLGEEGSILGLCLVSATGFALYFNATLLLSCLLIPPQEWRRLFVPLTSSASPAAIKPARIGYAVALISFVALFLVVPLLANLEELASQRLQSPIDKSEQSPPLAEGIFLVAEEIGDSLFQPGTLSEIERTRVRASAAVSGSVDSLIAESELAFQVLENNVDTYLDWYYSLGGELGRTFMLLTGNIEQHMSEKLIELLNTQEAFAGIELAQSQAMAQNAEMQAAFETEVQTILQANLLTTGDAQLRVSRSVSLESLLSEPVNAEFVDIQGRLSATMSTGAVAAAVTAVLVPKLTGKIMGKSTFKLASNALAKLITSKAVGTAAGATAGAATGGTVGSVVPVFGTAVGAAVGGLVGGIAAGLALDKALLEFEEATNRAAFREEILLSIRESRDEFLALLTQRQ